MNVLAERGCIHSMQIFVFHFFVSTRFLIARKIEFSTTYLKIHKIEMMQ